MYKDITFDEQMKEAVASGINKVASAVASTLGPAGRTVIIESTLENGTPTITKDGVSVAKSISLEDPVENIGAALIKNIAGRTNLTVGDGTTTSTVLAKALVEEGMTQLKKGVSPINIKNGINQALNDAVGYLKKVAKPVNSREEIVQVASISSNDDIEIGNLIAEAMENIGRDGVITVEDSQTTQTYIKYVEGMQLNKGYISAYFCNNRDSMLVDFKNPLILIYKGVINRAKELLPILEYSNSENKPLLIIANDVVGEALTTLVYNSLQGTVQVCAVKSPGYGDELTESLKDIAIITGATLVDQDAGMKLESATPAFLGSADSIRVDYNSTVIVNGKGDNLAINDRVEKLRKDVEILTGYEKEKVQDRLAKMSGGIAVLNIGATTDVELKEKKHRIEDALNATRAAIAEGIIPGGGITLRKISEVIKPSSKLNEEEKIGYNIVKNSLSKPFTQMLENAGINNIEMKTLSLRNSTGFDVLAKKWVNMYKAGIIDPVKVTRSALENAVSVASLVLTSSCVITNKGTDE